MNLSAPLVVDKDNGIRADALKFHQDGAASPIRGHMNRPLIPHPGHLIAMESLPLIAGSRSNDARNLVLAVLPTARNPDVAPISGGLFAGSLIAGMTRQMPLRQIVARRLVSASTGS
jgi:hypothetical protein